MDKEITIENPSDIKITEKDKKDMRRLLGDLEILISTEKPHCVLNVILNMALTMMVRLGYSDDQILAIIPKITENLRKHYEK